MVKLPHWVITDTHPGFYDSESATAIEQTAKLYKAVQDFKTDYNKYAVEHDAAIEAFEESTNQKVEEYKKCIEQMMLNHISCVDNKLDKQTKDIIKELEYIRNNIYITVHYIIEEMFNDGLIKLAHHYDAETENLDITLDYGLTDGGEEE